MTQHTLPQPDGSDKPLLSSTMLALREAGMSIIPVDYTTKSPAFSLLTKKWDEEEQRERATWEPYQERIASEVEISQWTSLGLLSYGIVAGDVSGGLVVIDFDDLRFYDAWLAEVGELADGLPTQETGGGGRHVFARCPNPGGNQKLAWAADESEDTGRRIAIETRGEGGYAVGPGSLHPFGNRYRLLSGDLTAIPFISQARIDALLAAACKLDEAPKTRQEIEAEAKKSTTRRVSLNGMTSVIDAYNAVVPIQGILEEHGYKRMGKGYARPAGEHNSVTVRDGRSFHHNTNDPLCDGYWHDAFDVFCMLAHGGNYARAVKAAAQLLQIERRNGNDNVDELLLSFSADDNGNAEAIKMLYGGRIAYNSAYGWIWHNGTHWSRREGEASVQEAVTSTLVRRRHVAISQGTTYEAIVRAARPSAANVRGALYMLTSKVFVPVESFDSNPDLINVANGVLDLRTGQIVAHETSQRFTYCLDVPYDPDADTGPWNTFYHDVLESDEIVEYWQEVCGYFLTGHVREECLWYGYGPGGAGKGTATGGLLALMGKPLSAEVSFALFADRLKSSDTNNFELAPLKAARLIVASESSKRQALNTERLKLLTGRNEVHCSFKYKDHFTYVPQFKIFLVSNEDINADPDDQAIWDRLKKMRFPKKYRNTPYEDKGLKDRLYSRENLTGLLAWSISGSIRWYQRPNGLVTPASVRAATRAARDALDYVQQWLDDRTERVPGVFSTNEELLNSYRHWCRDNGIDHPKSMTGLSQALGKKGYEVGKIKTINGKSTRGVNDLKVSAVRPYLIFKKE